MDGDKALHMMKNFRWDPVNSGLEMILENDQVFIMIEGSQTVKGHYEYLVEWNKLQDYLKLYGYVSKVYPYDYKLNSNYSLIEKFANLNKAFVFDIDPKIEQVNNIFLKQCIHYNQRLALPKDSMYFVGCRNDIFKLPGQLDGLLYNKPIQKLFIEEERSEGKFFLDGKAIKKEDLDKWRSYLIMSKYSDIANFKIEEEISFDWEKYYIREPVKTTNIILPKLCNNMDRVCEIIKENISRTILKDIYDLSFTGGLFSIKFASMFGNVKTIANNSLDNRITSYNIGLLPSETRSKIKIIKSEKVKDLRDSVIFLDKFIFEGEFDISKNTTNTVIIRTPEKMLMSLPKGFSKLYYLNSKDGFVIFYNL